MLKKIRSCSQLCVCVCSSSSAAHWHLMKSGSCTGKVEQRPMSPQISSFSADRWVIHPYCCGVACSTHCITGGKQYAKGQDWAKYLTTTYTVKSTVVICRRCCSWTGAAPCGRSCVLQLKEPCCCIRPWSPTKSATETDNTTNIRPHHRMDPDDPMKTFQLSSGLY